MNDHILSVNTHLQQNVHPVDQLANVREIMKILRDLEDELKSKISQMMVGADVLGGDEYVARQTLAVRAGAIDAKAMEKAGIDVEKYRKAKVTVYSIVTEKRELEVEA